jgi:hypothetical protein
MAVVALVLSAFARAAADPAEVEALIAKGIDLRREGRPGEALPYLKKAYELLHSPRTAGQLGLCELSAGYPIEAEQHLTAALGSPEHPWISKYRGALGQALSKARAQIGELVVEGTPSGASVVVNGRDLGSLPLAAPVKVPAGNVEVTIRAPGYSDLARSMRVEGGEKERLSVSLDRLVQVAPVLVEPVVPTGRSLARAPAFVSQPAGPPPRPPGSLLSAATQPGTRSTSVRRSAAWIAGGGAAVFLAAAIGFEIAANGKAGDFNASCTTAGGIQALTASQLSPDQCRDLYNSGTLDKDLSLVGYVAGGALTAASGVLFWTSRAPTSSRDFQARLQCFPSLGTVSCSGVF